MAKAKAEVLNTEPRRPFVFVHVGDLHLVVHEPEDSAATKRRKDRLKQDVNDVFADIAGLKAQGFDFVFLPGDIADDGYARQYAVLSAALKSHPVGPIQLIPGDHDRQHGCMDDFEAFRNTMDQPPVVPNPVQMDADEVTVRQFYYAKRINGVHCIFLDMISAGHGRKGIGLDFRLGEQQAKWFMNEVRSTLDAEGRPLVPCAVFMHTYPADLHVRSEATDAAGVIWNGHVRLVEMGHTHYNEITPDGRTHYAAARSVGQNEDGSTGYAVCALDGDVVSWRFKAADKGWPFVLITSPADRRVATSGGSDTVDLRALVLSDRRDVCCQFRVDDGFWTEMDPPATGDRCFTAHVPWPRGSEQISVRAWHPVAEGEQITESDLDVVEPVDGVLEPCLRPEEIGSDDLHLSAWPVKGIRGDQLGPNRVGRNW